MSDRLQELVAFVRTAECGSFSQASRELGLSQPSISRIISQLEARLGVKLLLRTTRRVEPTAAGRTFLERARQVLQDLEAAEDAARDADSLRGQLRVAMPVTFGLRAVLPALAPFAQRHARLRLEIVMSDDRHDLIAVGADVAIRVGNLDDSGFGARKISTLQRYTIAAPAYVALRGAPRTPAELRGHDLVFGPGSAARRTWAFERDGATTSVEVSARICVDTGEGMMVCVRAGLGIAIASDIMCRNDLAAGAVVPLLPGYSLAPLGIYAVFPGGPRPSRKVSALVDHLRVALQVAASVT